MSQLDRPLRGSCHCGGIVFEITGRPGPMGSCHCSRCRKASGSAFHTGLLVRARYFHWCQGEELVGRYRPPAAEGNLVRCFCKDCGSYLGEPATNEDAFPISAALLDDDPGRDMAAHEWVGSKAPWYEIEDDRPQFEGDHSAGHGEGLAVASEARAGGRQAADVAVASPLLGSCLCGEVRYEVHGGIHHMTHCHCRSCRKSQGAAFATNFSLSRSRFELQKGETAIREYESSPGKFRCFCRLCGGKLFAHDERLPEVVRIRMGSLDGNPLKRPLAHCWVSTKVSWLQIGDAIPKFAEFPPAPDEPTRNR